MTTSVTDRPTGATPPRDARRRDRWRRGRRGSAVAPYLFLLPAVVVLVAMLGYPLWRLGVMSLQEFGLKQVFGQPADWVGDANYRAVLCDRYFWTVLGRTLAFTVVNVTATMGLGLGVALLLDGAGRAGRVAMSSALVLAWAMPALTSTVVWQWIFDTQYGLANWALGRQGESWLADPLSFYAVASIVVIWMGIPFVAITLYAGLSQIPDSLIEAAVVDGAGPWQRFTGVTVPMLKPILLVLTALSILWDFRVFTQIYVLQRAGGISRDTNLLGVHAYRVGIGENRFDIAAALAVIMVLITLALSFGYLRSLLRTEEL